VSELPTWLDALPEARTRPLAIQAMVESRILRREFYRHANDIIEVATRMAGHRLGHQVVTFVYHDKRKHFSKWDKALEHQRYNQLVSILQNVYHNACNRVLMKICWLPTQDWDHLRKIPDWLDEESKVSQ
jgi:hypothetical protein